MPLDQSFYRIRYYRPNPDKGEGGRLIETEDTAGARGLADVLGTVQAYVAKKVNTDRVDIYYCEKKSGQPLREVFQWTILKADRNNPATSTCA